MIDSIIPKSNPVPQGIFCLGVMFVQLDLSRSRRRRRWWLLPLVPAVLWLCLPRLAAALPAAAARADRVIGARYTARLDALQQENFALHQRLAASADAVAENEALRSLLGSGRAVGCVTPARVLDAGGRYAGAVTSSDGNCCTAAFTAAAGLCGSCVGLATPGKWVLTGLPADCTLTAGEIVTTPGGDWLGILAAAPVPDADGLTASAPLTDTADLHAAVYFVRTD